MASRFPPSNDSRYVPRDHDRSPPPFHRRGSISYGSGQGPRNSDSSYRPGDLQRDPPRGPKAAQDGGRGGSYAPRGRGYHGRGDPRELRDPHIGRRDQDRGEWPRRDGFDSRDRRASPPGRNRSRTPPARDARGGPRELDTNRVPRGGGPPSAESANSDGTQTSGGHYGRGGYRGRGRGDWDRGRGGRGDDRDSYRVRSRSRDRTWDQDFRDSRGRDYDRDAPRRGDDDKRESWAGEDRQKRDPPLRPDSRNSTGSHANLPQSSHPNPPNTAQVNTNRFRDNAKPPAAPPELLGKSTWSQPPNEFRAKDNIKVHPARQDLIPQVPSSPPQPTPVPAFGSITARTGPTTPGALQKSISPRDDQPPSGPARDVADPIKAAPKAPKAELNQNQPPSGPKAGTPFQRRVASAASPGRPFDSHHDAPGGPSPQISRFGGPARPAISPGGPSPNQARPYNQWTAPHLNFKSHHLDSSPQRPSPSTSEPGRSSHLDGGVLTSSGPKIPTGPKAAQPSIRAPMGPRGFAGKSATWINPILQQQRPSILANMSPSTLIHRGPPGEERAKRLRAKSVEHSPASHLKPGPKPSILGDRAAKMKMMSDDDKMDVSTEDPNAQKSESERVAEAVEELELQGDSVSDEDDDMDLDEEDFKDAERQFQKDLEHIEAKRPASPKHHPELLALLEEVDALASALEHLQKGLPIPPPEGDESAPGGALGLPSPTPEPVDKDPIEDLRFEEASVSAELALDGLPYLVSGMPTPLSQISDESQGGKSRDAMKSLVFDCLADEVKREAVEEDEMRRAYVRNFHAWRTQVDIYDREKKEMEEQAKAAEALPASIPEPAPAPTPAPEGGRRNRAFNTQLELDQAIALSKAEAEEEEKKQREREALERQNQMLQDETKEARIPGMLTKLEQGDRIFDDTNNLVETRLVLDTFGFVPPEDDFNEEEQKQFIEGYVRTPKKWGHIALEIPGRDYQDCIQHYYLTKRDTAYKTLFSRKAGRRGRKGVRGPGRPRNNHLMADLGNRMVESCGDVEMVAVTDTGRPRRAAAPNFAEKEKKDAEPVAPKATPARRGANAAKAVGETPDGSAEKPVARRGRQPGATRERAKRGPKAAVPSISPSKPELEGVKSKEAKMEDGLVASQLDGAQALARLNPDQAAPLIGAESLRPETSRPDGKPSSMLAELTAAQLQPPQPLPSSALPTQPTVAAAEAQIQMQTQAPAPVVPPVLAPSKVEPRSGSQTNSYWSVQEQNDFITFLQHFGTDWHKISGALGTKTHTMVKNHYHRKAAENEHRIENIANAANDRIRQEGPPGPAPPTLGGQRKRNESLLHAAAQRPVAPVAESADGDVEIIGSNQALPVSPQALQHSPLAPLRQAPQRRQPIAVAAKSGATAEAGIPSGRGRGHGSRPSQQLQGAGLGFAEDLTRAPNRGAESLGMLSRRDPQGETVPSAGMDEQTYLAYVAAQQKEPLPASALDQHMFVKLMAAQHEQHMQDAQKQQGMHNVQPSQRMQDSPPVPNPLTQHKKSPSVQDHVSLSDSQKTSILGSGPEHLIVERSRPSIFGQQPPTDPSSPGLHRQSSYGGAQAVPPSVQSPIRLRPSVASPPYSQPVVARPSSVPASGQVSAMAPPPPQPAPALKRSNIMSILNDDPVEPPSRKPSSETKPPPSPQNPPMGASGSVYQHHGQPSHYHARDPVYESAQSQAHQQAQQQQQQIPPPTLRHAYGGQGFASQAPPSEAPPHPKDALWASSRSYYDPPSRPVYPPGALSSPSQPAYPPQHQARPSYHQPPPSHPATPPALAPAAPPPQPHTRGSSYSNIHPQIPQPVGQSIQPSPYANIRPPASAQPSPLAAHPPLPPQQPQLHPALAPQAPPQGPGGPHAQQQQQPHPRPSSAFALPTLAQHDPRRPPDAPPQPQGGDSNWPGHFLMRQDERRNEEMRLEEMRREERRREDLLQQEMQRRFTPPGGFGRYAPPPPGPQPGQGGEGGLKRRYDDRL